jgi:hypothetical protein
MAKPYRVDRVVCLATWLRFTILEVCFCIEWKGLKYQLFAHPVRGRQYV